MARTKTTIEDSETHQYVVNRIQKMIRMIKRVGTVGPFTVLVPNRVNLNRFEKGITLKERLLLNKDIEYVIRSDGEHYSVNAGAI